MTPYSHTTVLKEEAARLVGPAPGRCVVDETLGGAGHSEAFLERGAMVIGIDQDPWAIEAARTRLARFGDRFQGVHASFRDTRAVLDSLGIGKVDGALVDLGVSSPQLDAAERGFSFGSSGPLDMRMDRTQGKTLAELIAAAEEGEIARVIRDWGEEPMAFRIARAIKHADHEGRLTDTRALADVVSGAIPRARWPKTINPATRTFQALRIWVNDELGALSDWLDALPDLIAVGGRACAIAFHSLEDRPVKQRFAALSKGCICPPDLPICGCGKTAGWRLLTRKAVVAGEAEIEANPRARSARLRCIERLAA